MRMRKHISTYMLGLALILSFAHAARSAPIFGTEPVGDASGSTKCEIYGVGYEI